MSDDDTQLDAERQRRLEETARRLNALALRWDDKVEAWQQETAMSETTFVKILKRCGLLVPEQAD
jgi:hypothetical protein